MATYLHKAWKGVRILLQQPSCWGWIIPTARVRRASLLSCSLLPYAGYGRGVLLTAAIWGPWQGLLLPYGGYGGACTAHCCCGLWRGLYCSPLLPAPRPAAAEPCPQGLSLPQTQVPDVSQHLHRCCDLLTQPQQLLQSGGAEPLGHSQGHIATVGIATGGIATCGIATRGIAMEGITMPWGLEGVTGEIAT